MKAFGQRKSKRGFTLIELLIVMVILAILAGVIVLAVAGVFNTTGQAAYTSVRSEIENAVTAYSANTSHPGSFPRIGNATTVDGTDYYVIDFNQLVLGSGGLMKTMPTGLYFSNASGTDNCNGLDTGCDDGNHYVWMVSATGMLMSSCINASATNGGGCQAGPDVDGFQGVWP